ncbi:uncharacterized protein LOC133037151 [Cannabis sativa]|uniref:uncharacterized protein LOC133037151 n=1 Tax=Cannabis sativa TaxID=3483 RepID=UPI0029CA9EB1|nr:uncharacterized protein LOC133037151 [Cannabis sativa]
MHSLQKDMLKQKANYEKKLSSDVQHECKYTAYGFAHAVQYWAYEAILEVGKRYGTNHGIRFPRMLSWTSKGDIGKKDVSALFSRRNLEVVKGLLPRTEEEAFVRTISYDGVENLVDDVVDDTEAEAGSQPSGSNLSPVHHLHQAFGVPSIRDQPCRAEGWSERNYGAAQTHIGHVESSANDAFKTGGPSRSIYPTTTASPPEEDEVFPDDYDPYEGAPPTPIEAQPLIHVHDTESQGEILSMQAQPASG